MSVARLLEMRGLHQSPSLIAVKTKWKLRSRRPFSVVRAQSRDEGGSDVAPSNFRVLAFEDSYNIKNFLADGRVVYGAFRQCWDTGDAIEEIRKFEPDVLLLDYYIPPFTGLNVLRMVNREVKMGNLKRPRYIIGMSSVSHCNQEMLAAGADAAYIKWDMPQWHKWSRSE